MERVFHRVQVVQISEEFVESVHSRQEFVAVAKVVLTELPRGIAHRFKAVAIVVPAWQPDQRLLPVRPSSSRTLRKLTSDEVGTAGRATASA